MDKPVLKVYYGDMAEMDSDVRHYGVARRSGRYPWGSGKMPFQHSGDFLSRVEEYQKSGMSEKEIAEAMGMTTTSLRMQKRVAAHERRDLLADRARSLRDDGKTLDQIAAELGFKNDSSVRALLNETTKENKNKAKSTADILEQEIKEKGVIDISAGTELMLNVTPGVLKEAAFILETRGYVHDGYGQKNVLDPTKQTITEYLGMPGTEQRDIYQNPELVQNVGEFHSRDGGLSWDHREYPSSISSDRVKINYGDEGGSDKDGVIEIRPGVEDLSLGNSHYAQVRIMVDGTHYLKGMAMYSENVPEGYDIMFNTNKPSGTPKEKVLKEIKTDNPDDPFGAYIKANGQSYYPDPKGKYKDPLTGERCSLSPINKLKEEGDWENMSKNLSSQFLSKQPMKLIHSQLDLAYADAKDEFAEINALTNPTIKRKLLMDFADQCDAASYHMKAAALPRQSTQVILPIASLKDGEIFAPNYDNGETVCLVRYPHAGTFEIPKLKVNNKNPEGLAAIGPNVRDAVGINPKTAKQLSGADFDGDQVVVLPLRSGAKVNVKEPYKDLQDFDPGQYSTEGRKNFRVMTEDGKQREMGIVSNMITDMTLKGAPEKDIIRAVKYSMVVIDAVKHKYDYKQARKDLGIAELKKTWQAHLDEETGEEKYGASTLISRRKQTVPVPERKGSGIIDPVTGEVTYRTTGRKYRDANGNLVDATTKIPLVLATKDVRDLSSGTPQENAYADYANKMKALANQARAAYKNAGTLRYSASAAEEYAPEVSRLESALKLAQLNAPKERRAQRIAASRAEAKIQANGITDKDVKKLIRREAIKQARYETGADGKGTRINISKGEWRAIQAGAITDTKLTQILRYADADVVRSYATPRTRAAMPQSKINRARAMSRSGFTYKEIADALGYSASTIGRYLNPTSDEAAELKGSD